MIRLVTLALAVVLLWPDPQLRIRLRGQRAAANVCASASYPGSGCSGSGTSWACAAGATVGQINTVVGSASDDANICFKSGSYTWGAEFTLSNSKGVHFICETERECLVDSDGMGWGLFGTLSGANTKTYELNGFKLTGGENVVWFYAGSNGASMTGVKVVNNWFADQTADNRIILIGDNNDHHKIYGVVANNLFTNASSVMALEFFGTNNDAAAPSDTRGTINNLFFEDNTITITTQTNAGLGCLDVTDKASVVVRYNTYTNCLMTAHGVTHSWGPVNFEFYGNHCIATAGMDSPYEDGDACFHHQGSGLITVFDNQVTPFSGHGNGPIDVTHYRSTTAEDATGGSTFLDGTEICDGNDAVDGNYSGQSGYPCKRQPGRSPDGSLHPIYIWNNYFTDNLARARFELREPWINPVATAVHIKMDRDVFEAVSASAQTTSSSPFDGTTGMGFGTIARRPATCSRGITHANDAGEGGVGYWATDEGEWKTANGATPDGRLYACTSTDNWALEYTPYTYPHPAR